MKNCIYLSAYLIAAIGFSGCVAKVDVEKSQRIMESASTENLSLILTRISKSGGVNYVLSTKDIALDSNDFSLVKDFTELKSMLKEKGYIVEIIANKYRQDLPKVIAVYEKGRYAGALSTVQYYPLKGKTFSEVLTDVGLLIKFNILLDEDVIAENKHLTPPSEIFKGKTVADLLDFCEKAYDYHVDIKTQSATITIKKYKSVVVQVLADKAKIIEDSKYFIQNGDNDNKAKQFVADNGKIFITGTPSAIEKVTRYAAEVNSINKNRAILSFDGKLSVADILSDIGKSSKKMYIISDGNFIPEKDSGVWVETFAEVDEYIRKNYNKRLTLISQADIDRDGEKDHYSYTIREIRGVSLSSPITVSKFFKALEKIDGDSYIVDGDANIPVSKAIVDDFEHLRAHVWSSAGVKIIMTDPGAGLPKIIKVEE